MESVREAWEELDAALWAGDTLETALASKLQMQSLDNFGGNILHYAARSECCSGETYRRLIDGLPADFLEATSNDQRTAMHYAAGIGKNVEVIRVLLELVPHQVEQEDSKGFVPLHAALVKSHPMTFEVVHALLLALPEAITWREKLGNFLPLHMAVSGGLDVDTVRLLCAVCNSAAACSDIGKSERVQSRRVYPHKVAEADANRLREEEEMDGKAKRSVMQSEKTTKRAHPIPDPRFAGESTLHFQRSAAAAKARLALLSRQQTEEEKEEALTRDNKRRKGLRDALLRWQAEKAGDLQHRGPFDQHLQAYASFPNREGILAPQGAAQNEVLRLMAQVEGDSHSLGSVGDRGQKIAATDVGMTMSEVASDFVAPQGAAADEVFAMMEQVNTLDVKSPPATPQPEPAPQQDSEVVSESLGRRPSAAFVGLEVHDDWSAADSADYTGEWKPPRLPFTSPLDSAARFLTNHSMRPTLPIHMALDRLRPDWQVVEALISASPASAGVPNVHETFPLLIAMKRRAPASILRLILKAHPASTFVRYREASDDDKGMTVMQYALDIYTGSLDQVKPSAVEALSSSASSAAAAVQKTYSSIDEELSEKQQKLEEQTQKQLQRVQDDEESLLAIISAFEDSAFDRSNITGSMPVDVAVERKMWRVCAYLLEHCLRSRNKMQLKKLRCEKLSKQETKGESRYGKPNPLNNKEKDEDVDLSLRLSDEDPLMDAFTNGASLSLMLLIMEVYPLSPMFERTNPNLWPLHEFCTKSEDAEHVRVLLHQFPPAAAQTDYYGKLPMHILCEGKADVRTPNRISGSKWHRRVYSLATAVAELAAAHPNALSTADPKGRIPYEIAMAFRCSAPVINALLRWHGAPTAEKNVTTGLVPFFDLDASYSTLPESGNDFELLVTLLKHSLPILWSDCDSGTSANNYYCNVWHDVLADPSDRYHNLIERILDDLSLVHLLAMSKESQSHSHSHPHTFTHTTHIHARKKSPRTALEVASADSRHLLMRRMYFAGRFQLPPVKVPVTQTALAARINEGGTYYQARKPETLSTQSPVRLSGSRRHKFTAANAEEKTKDETKQEPIIFRDKATAIGKMGFMCALLANEKTVVSGCGTRQVGIIFCEEEDHKHLVHKAELSRLEAQRLALPVCTMKMQNPMLGSGIKTAAETPQKVTTPTTPTAHGSELTDDIKNEGDEGTSLAKSTSDPQVLESAVETDPSHSDWWQAYMEEPEVLQWLDTEVEDMAKVTFQNNTLTLTHAQQQLETRYATGAGFTNTMSGSPLPAATLVKPHLEKSGRDGGSQTHAPGAFHGFPLLCTLPCHGERERKEFVNEQLERALGAHHSQVSFCAVYNNIDSPQDLLRILTWLSETVANPESEELALSHTHKEKEEEKKEEEEEYGVEVPALQLPPPLELNPPVVDWKAALEVAIASCIEIEMGAIMLIAAAEDVDTRASAPVQEEEGEEEPATATTTSTSAEPVVVEPAPEPELSPDTPRSAAGSSTRSKRSKVKPPIVETHRNGGVVVSPAL